ncbi:MAG: VWA domain-containing protein, partial [Proteobacteria bacterium]|nr:VWA domain-containing protein [Pseudomonadota bacterium]
VYAGDAFTVTPLTDYSATILSQLKALSTDIMPVQGNRTDIALVKAVQLLKQAGLKSGNVLLMTDEIDVEQTRAEAISLQQQGYRLFVLGIGTDHGVPVPLADGSFLKDSKGKIVVPVLHEKPMQSIAKSGGGRYLRMTVDDRDIDSLQTIFSSTGIDGEIETTELQTDVWYEQGPWLLIFLLPLTALLFRRGYLVILIFLLPFPQKAQAFDWNNLWLTADQRAKQVLDYGDHKQAAAIFKDPHWKAAAYYQAGEFDAAVESLATVENIVGLYNKANALARSGRYQQAIDGYKKVLEKKSDHGDALYNKKLLEDELEKQQQQQDNQQSDKKQDNQDRQDKQQQGQQPSGDMNKDQEPQQSSSDQQQAQQDKQEQQQAEQQAAGDVAARHYENCLTLVSEADDMLGEDEAGLLTELAQCWQKSAEFRQAWRCLTRAINLYRERGDGVGMARATLAARMQATPEQERAQREAALVSLADDDPHTRALLLVPERVDFSESAERDAARAAKLARTHEFADVEAQLLDRESHRALYERRFVDVPRAARTAFQAFDVLNDVTNAAHHLTDIAMVHLMSGDLDQADTAAIEGRDYARKSRLRLWEQWNIAILGACTLLRCQNDRFDALAREMPGRHEFMDMLAAARAERAGDMERALALAPTMDSVAAGGSVTLGQVVAIQGAYARVLYNAGDENAARSQLSAWGQSFNGLDYILFAAPGLAEVDECLTVLGDDELVQSVYERAVQWESVRSGPYSSQGIDHILGALALRLDSVDEAEQHYRTGLEWCERERCPVEAGRCLQGLAAVAERRGNTAEALPLLDRAAAL